MTNLSVDVAYYGYFSELVAMGDAFVVVEAAAPGSVKSSK